MEFVVGTSGERLDKFLAQKLPQFSRSKIQRLIKAGAVKINGRIAAKTGTELRRNDRVAVTEDKLATPTEAYRIEPESDISLNIVYEDNDIIIVNKPAGLLTHPTPNQPRHTLVNALVARYPDIIKVGENPLRPGIVHRLDKDTSGLLMVAKNQKAFLFLKEQFMKRAVVKKYLALTEGVPSKKEGVIEYAIRPSKQFRLKRVAVKPFDKLKARKSVRAAKTEYKIRQELDHRFALLEVSPLTGRTHQIRVHLAAIGHPVVGDRLYGSKTKIKRQFLHAYYLKFTAPNGTPLALETKLSEDLQKILTEIQK